MPELLDIVNEHDEAIGQMAFSDILKNDHIIRVSHVWVVNDQNQFLIHRGLYDSHMDASTGGRVKPGETYEDAAQRKIQDTGLPNCTLTTADKYFLDMPGLRMFVQVFLIRANGALALDPDRYQWLSLTDLDAMVKRQPQLFVPNITNSLNAVRNLI